ncbi:sodium-transporting two-sector ATPase [Candidatus Saccharibacteria bacterium]|nr:sodium-transporting two-sector ATPase [Candidatus Saccharibacteria bacterium]
MFDNALFQKLVEADNLTGEVVAINRFIVEVKGLEGVRIGAQILFEDGQRGFVREAHGDRVILYNIDSENLTLGCLAVVEYDQLSIPVGPELIGRVVTPMGVPVDDKGQLTASQRSGIFTPAPGIMDRKMLNQQLASGVTAVDSFFPIVLGQRIAILGDSKSGKSTFLSQLSANQEGLNRIVVYVLIGKRKVDIERLLRELKQNGSMDHTIVVLANIFDSLTQSYLAPYAAAAMAENLWYNGQDVIIIYDDLSSHAEAYRQLSLLQEVDPGRDSYPGDIFYTHSSLLERAGKLLTNDKTLTSLPVVLTPNDDITAYLSTNIMSITDGQIIFDLGYFRKGVRPAVNAGLSVSRVGGQAQTKRQKQLSTALFKALAHYHQAEEFSHFSSQLSKETRLDLARGKHLYAVLMQPPEELFSLTEQQLMLETIMLSQDDRPIDVVGLKKAVLERAGEAKTDEDYDRIEAELLAQFAPTPLTEAKPTEEKDPSQAESPPEADKKDGKKKDDKKVDKK